MPARKSRAYTQRHFRDVAALLAAERAAHGPSPALNRITTAFAALFAEDSQPDAAAGNPRHFNRKLFGQAARGQVAPTARQPAENPAPSAVPQRIPDADVLNQVQPRPTGPDWSGWTTPVVIALTGNGEVQS